MIENGMYLQIFTAQGGRRGLTMNEYMTYRQVVLIVMLYDIVKQIITYFVKKIL